MGPHHFQLTCHVPFPGLYSCPGCLVQTLYPQPTSDVLRQIYGDGYFESFSLGDDFGASLRRQKRWQAMMILYTANGVGKHCGRLLDIGSGKGELIDIAFEHGWYARGVELNKRGVESIKHRSIIQGDFATLQLPGDSFDLVTACDTLEHLREPLDALRKIRGLLVPGGVLVLTTPDCTSLAARVLGRRWFHYHRDHIWYFSRPGIAGLLRRSGFLVRSIGRCWKRFTGRYILSILQQSGNPSGFKGLSRALLKVLPKVLVDTLLPPLPEGLIAVAQKCADCSEAAS